MPTPRAQPFNIPFPSSDPAFAALGPAFQAIETCLETLFADSSILGAAQDEILTVPLGGTGLSAFVTGDILVASTATTIDGLTAVIKGSVLISQGVLAAPAYLAPGTSGFVLTSAGSGVDPVWVDPTTAEIDADNITTGTLADARLSSNVPLKDAFNTFSARQAISISSSGIIGLFVENAHGSGTGLYVRGGGAVEMALIVENATGATSLMTVRGDGDAFMRGPVRFTNLIKIGGTALRATTEGTSRIDIFDATNPAGTLANGVSLYSSGGKLFAMDAGGAPTQLTP